ncbi:MAG TPA: hypothetical protein VGG14_08135 [Candidatus Sulfotelmatobacter sp.]
MTSIVRNVNGRPESVEVDPETALLYLLSDELHLPGPKFGTWLAPRI